MSKDLDLGEQAISKAVELGLESQLEQAETLEVSINTDAGKLVQGELDAVEVKGQGLVMEQGLRSEKLHLATNAISINPLKAAVGEIEIEKPVEAKTVVVLTETDIEAAFNSPYIGQKLETLQIEVEGQTTHIKPHQVEFSIPEIDTICLRADVELVQTGEVQKVAFKAQPRMAEAGHQVVLENVEPLDEAKAQPALTQALVAVAADLLDLRNFELGDMSLRFERLTVVPGQIKLQAEATINSLPS
ncbi:LmeA family phospholipid-binding protein [Almyronema epifaneia]|uniref:DUF2993 domain-containing protein n=1 Tax=Almyronema epifaneia S1 TaxID=2991925 RepID=A0ABW6IH71_9CYAN